MNEEEWTRKVMVVNWLYASAATLLGFEYFLTFDREVRLIWLSPWSYTKLLFILTRYLPIIATSLLMYNQLSPLISRHTCNITWAIAAWLLMIGMNSAEVIIMIRTWAVWGRDWRVGLGFAGLMMGALIVQVNYMAKAINSAQINLPSSPNYDDYVQGCVVISVDPGIFFANMISFSVVDTIVLALMMISAFRTLRSNHPSRLLHIVHRDSLLFYAYLFCLVLIEPIFMARRLDVSQNPGLFLMILVQAIIYSILTARIVFNIRSASENDASVELHTTLTLEFRIGDAFVEDVSYSSITRPNTSAGHGEHVSLSHSLA